MVKLTRLKIEKFRNVEPVEIKFSHGMNVLLGINGSGKTTFLELIAALVSQNLSKFDDEEFSIEYDLVLDDVSFDVRIDHQHVQHEKADSSAKNRRPGSHTLRVQVVARILMPTIEYRIDANSKSISTVSREAATGVEKTGTAPGLTGYIGFLNDALTSFWSLSKIDRRQRSWTALHELMAVSRFDESLGFFYQLLDNDGWIESYGDVKAPEPGLEFFHGPRTATSLIQAFKKMEYAWLNWRESKTITLSARDVPFLRTLLTLTELKDATLELRLTKREVDDVVNIGRVYFTFGMLHFWFEKVGGTIIPEQKLSYGQKRLLSFFYYLDCNPHVILADELAAGLHHAWITACVDAIGDRQAFLASQDPLLIDEIEISSVDDVERSFILCRCDMSSGRERLVWSNMSRYDAERFFEAYNVGLQHVSEILRTKRLW